MLLTRRRFEREPPSRSAKSLFIFCEGARTEFRYFSYFKEMDSRVNVEVYPLDSHENNSPLGLLNIAQRCIQGTAEEGDSTSYDFQEGDEVWLVLDTDRDKANQRLHQLNAVQSFCNQNEGWEVVISNPCFEVWLYYHHDDQVPVFEGDETCKAWKKRVNDAFGGGFDARKHPIFIASATQRASRNYQTSPDGQPLIGVTEVFRLGTSLCELLNEKLHKALNILP